MPFKLEGIQRVDETPVHKAIREAFVNLIIHADYFADAGTLKVIKKNKSFEFTNPGILKLPVEEIFRGGNSKPRNSHMQTMLRMVGFGDNAGSGFPTIISVWNKEGWIKPELIEDTVLNQVTLKLNMVTSDVHHPVQNEQDNEQDIIRQMLLYCKEPRTMTEIVDYFGFKNRLYLKRHFLDALLSKGRLKMTLPDKPSSKNQKYYS